MEGPKEVIWQDADTSMPVILRLEHGSESPGDC